MMWGRETYIRSFFFGLILQNVPKNIDTGIWFDRYACLHA